MFFSRKILFVTIPGDPKQNKSVWPRGIFALLYLIRHFAVPIFTQLNTDSITRPPKCPPETRMNTDVKCLKNRIFNIFLSPGNYNHATTPWGASIWEPRFLFIFPPKFYRISDSNLLWFNRLCIPGPGCRPALYMALFCNSMPKNHKTR